MDIYYIMACSSLVFVKIWVSVTSLYVQGVGRDKLVSEASRSSGPRVDGGLDMLFTRQRALGDEPDQLGAFGYSSVVSGMSMPRG